MHVPRLAVIKNYRLQSLFKKNTWTMLVKKNTWTRQAIACMPCMFACSPFCSPFLAGEKTYAFKEFPENSAAHTLLLGLVSLVLFHSAC